MKTPEGPPRKHPSWEARSGAKQGGRRDRALLPPSAGRPQEGRNGARLLMRTRLCGRDTVCVALAGQVGRPRPAVVTSLHQERSAEAAEKKGFARSSSRS